MNEQDDNVLNDIKYIFNEEELQKPTDQSQRILELGFLSLYQSLNEIRLQLQRFIKQYENDQNQEVVSVLQQNLDQMGNKLELIKNQTFEKNRDSIIETFEEMRRWIIISSLQLEALSSNQPQQSIEEFSQLPKHNKRDSKKKCNYPTNQQFVLLEIKKVFKQIKMYLIIIFLWVHNFVKNAENIQKCVIIAATFFFLSAYIQIPDMKDQSMHYILDWLAYNKSSRTLIISTSTVIVLYEWYFMHLLWLYFSEQESGNDIKKLKLLIHDCNPILQLSLVFLNYTNLINNKFDLMIWFCNYFLFSIFRVYYLHIQLMIKNILSNLTPVTYQNIFQTRQISKFSLVVFFINLIYMTLGIWVLYNLGFCSLFLLFFGGFTTCICQIKLLFICRSLQYENSYYLDNNTNELKEPFFYSEQICDSIYYILRLIFCLILLCNYFKEVSLQFVLHLWLFYLLSDCHQSLYNLIQCYISVKQLFLLQKKAEIYFPRVIPQPDEICSICHDELLNARSLPCQHRFHLKCLFNWLKQKPHCPVCRQPVNNKDLFNNENNSIFWRFFSFLSNITLLNITIYFQSANNQELQLEDQQHQLVQQQPIQQQPIQQQPQQQPQQQQVQQQQQNIQGVGVEEFKEGLYNREMPILQFLAQQMLRERENQLDEEDAEEISENDEFQNQFQEEEKTDYKQKMQNSEQKKEKYEENKNQAIQQYNQLLQSNEQSIKLENEIIKITPTQENLNQENKLINQVNEEEDQNQENTKSIESDSKLKEQLFYGQQNLLEEKEMTNLENEIL